VGAEYGVVVGQVRMQTSKLIRICPNFAKAVGDIARARGMMQLARDTSIIHEQLYKALGEQGAPPPALRPFSKSCTRWTCSSMWGCGR